MLEKMKAAFSNLSAIASAYLPKGFKETMLDMAAEIDRRTVEINEIRNELNQLKEQQK